MGEAETVFRNFSAFNLASFNVSPPFGGSGLPPLVG
jgi:hypothetical protein